MSNGAAGPESSEIWALKDIIYVSVIGPVMLAAFLEWILWLAAFCYCLVKVYKKAESWSTKFLACVMMAIFVALRAAFLPVMAVTLPLPPNLTRHFPPPLVSGLQWFAFWSFAVLLIIPWLLCVYRIATTSLGRTKQIKQILDEYTAPKTVVVMPVYKEHPDVLLTAINSVVDCEYPASCIHVFLSFDGDEVDELYLATADRLGIPVTVKDFPPSIDVSYNGARVTVSRFPHGGKRQCQKATFKLIDKVYEKYLQRNDNLFILFIDSDCILDKVCIQNFMYEMELKPGSKGNMLAMTGVITSTTEKNSLITLLQDMEYIHGQLFERSVESGCGSVTCLPGALTILRFSAFRNMAKFYFADKFEHCEDLFDYGKCHLGEDRWLTHLFMVGAKQRYQIQMCTNAFCKTEAVQTFRSLLKQRRRWFLGFITNEVCLLTDARLWRKYPVLCLVRFMQNTIRTTALLFFIMVISLTTTSQRVSNLPVGFIALSLGLNYLLMLYFGAKLGRFKAWLYPIMFVLNPFFNWIYMVYGIFTAGQRTWGGPRADAGAATTKFSPQEVIEQAMDAGDELNIIPETFRPAIEARRPGRQAQSSSLQPHPAIEGQFVPAEELPARIHEQSQTSRTVLPQTVSIRPRYKSSESYPMTGFDDVRIYTPLRLDDILHRQMPTQNERKSCSTSRSDFKSVRERVVKAESSATLDTYRSIAQSVRGGDSGSHERTASTVCPGSHAADPHELSERLSNLLPQTPVQLRADDARPNTNGRERLLLRQNNEDCNGDGDAPGENRPCVKLGSGQDDSVSLRLPPRERKRLQKRRSSVGSIV